MVKVLQLLTSLVKFGYYDDPADIKTFLPSIHKLLNGKEDFPTKESAAKEEPHETRKMRQLLYFYVILLD